MNMKDQIQKTSEIQWIEPEPIEDELFEALERLGLGNKEERKKHERKKALKRLLDEI